MRTWAKTYRSQAAMGGQKTTWRLGFPARCRIVRVVVVQVGGDAPVDFVLELYSGRLPAENGSSSSGGADPAGVYEADPLTYLPVGPLQGEAGRLFQAWETGYAYENTDGKLSTREPVVYAEITPEGSGDLTYDVAFTCELPVG